MVKVGRKIYYDINKGNVILYIGERFEPYIPTTVEEDIRTYLDLYKRKRDTFDVIELEPNEYLEEFLELGGYRVNTETKELEFYFRDEVDFEENGEVIYKKSLAKQIEELEEQKNQLVSDITEIQIENADLWHDGLMKDMKMRQLEEETADMWYAIMMGAV